MVFSLTWLRMSAVLCCRSGGSGLQRRVSVPDGGGARGGGAGRQALSAARETADGWIRL